MRKLISALLALCLCLGLCLPAAAVFSDISDENVNKAVAVLTGMDVVEGYGDGLFHGGDSLTRAQLCKLVVLLSGNGDAASAHERKTLYSDVKSTHWACGYINLASALGYVSGYGNGLFGPDDTVTYGQAVTMAINLLGYDSSDVGNFWPADYVSFAAENGLDEGLDSPAAGSAVTRAEAAVLLCNTLAATAKTGKSLACSVSEGYVAPAVLTGVSASSSGKTGQVSVSVSGKTEYYDQSVSLSRELVGYRGTLLLDAGGDVVGFVPDAGKTLTVTVASASANSLTDDNGRKYSLAGGAGLVVYGEYESWELGFADVSAGLSARLFYTAAGDIDLVYVSSSSSDAAVYVATTKVTAASNPFEKAFGLSKGSYTVVKNGAVTDASQLAQYDVATYDAGTGTLSVSDFRLSGAWEDAYPNASAPTRVTVVGHEFEVLSSVSDDFAKLSLGSQLTLLLTGDMKVAAVYSAGKVKASSPVGVLTSLSGKDCVITLVNGVTLTGTLSSGVSASSLLGSLVTVSGRSSGFTLSALSYEGGNGKWNVAARTVGSDSLAAGAKIYERVGGSTVTKISESDVLVSSVAAASIEYLGYDSAGRVSLMVVSDVTGDCYTYGMASTGTQTSGSGGVSAENKTVAVTNGSGKSDALITGHSFTDGAFIGVAGTAEGRLAGYVTLKKAVVSRSAFSGSESVTVGDDVLPISDDAQVYNSTAGTWTTLTLAKAYAESFTVYYDKTPDTGAKIRIITFG